MKMVCYAIWVDCRSAGNRRCRTELILAAGWSCRRYWQQIGMLGGSGEPVRRNTEAQSDQAGYPCHTRFLEVTGEKKKDKAAKVATAQTLWVPAVNNHGGIGRWAFLEIADPWDARSALRAQCVSETDRYVIMTKV